MPSQNIIVIAGMHRSGTSALTRAINLAGIPLPSNLLPPTPDNSDGYWESLDVMAIHARILESLGSDWADFREIPQAWFDSAEATRFGRDVADWIEREIAGKESLLVKDPRVCRLLPLWQTVCSDHGLALHTVIAVRNPLEVVGSLYKRNQFPAVKSALLWLRHFVDAERFTRGRSRSFVDFDQLMSGALANVRRIASELGIAFPVPDSELGPLLDAALKPSLRHHKATADDLAKAGKASSPPMIVYPWALDAAAGKNPPFDVLDRVAAQLKEIEMEAGGGIVYAPSV